MHLHCPLTALAPSLIAEEGPPRLMTYQGHLMDLSGDALGKTAPVNKLIQFDIFCGIRWWRFVVG